MRCSSYSTYSERIRIIHIIGYYVIYVLQNNTDCGVVRILRLRSKHIFGYYVIYVLQNNKNHGVVRILRIT